MAKARSRDGGPDFSGARPIQPARKDSSGLADSARSELRALKASPQIAAAAAAAKAQTATPTKALPGGADAEQRRRQIEFIQQFFSNPSVLELREAPVETLTTRAEIAKRRSDLQYRVDVMEAVLAVLREELQALDRVVPADGADPSTAPAPTPVAAPAAVTLSHAESGQPTSIAPVATQVVVQPVAPEPGPAAPPATTPPAAGQS